MSDHIQRSHGRAGSVVPEVREVVCLRKSRLEKRHRHHQNTTNSRPHMAPAGGPKVRSNYR